MSRWGKSFRWVAGAPTLWRVRHSQSCSVLVVGVYMRDKPNLAAGIAAGLISRRHHVTQAWASVGTGEHGVVAMQPLTRLEVAQPAPKFVILNRLLGMHDLSKYAYVIVTDDDIEFGPGFLDDFIGLQRHYGFALAQPARSQDSNVDHPVTLESHARMARQTRFVEIGPLFSIASAAFPVILPFDEAFYMGWGLDHVWPVALDQAGLRMGIIDCTPVHHRFRPVASTYSFDKAMSQMDDCLVGRETITSNDKLYPLRSYWW